MLTTFHLAQINHIGRNKFNDIKTMQLQKFLQPLQKEKTVCHNINIHLGEAKSKAGQQQSQDTIN